MVVKKISEKYIKFFIYLLVIALINIAGITLFFRTDLTKNKKYSISDASKKVVSSLSEPLTMKVFFTKNLPSPYNNIERYIHDLIEEYSLHGNRYFNYQFYDVSPEENSIGRMSEENRETAQNYGIYPVQIQTIEKDEVKFKKAYMGIVMIHGDIIEKIPTITSVNGLEYKLTTSMQKLNNKVSALLALPEQIKVKLFLSSSLNIVADFIDLPGLAMVPEQMEAVAKRLNKKNYGKLDFIYLDPSKDNSLEKQVEAYNIMTLKWPALSEDTVKPGSGSIGLIMEYKDKIVQIPMLHVLNIPMIGTRYQLENVNDLEDKINDNIESIIDINENIGYLTDHGTLNLFGASEADPRGHVPESGLGNFRTLLSQNYSIKAVSLKDDTIPGSINCLIVARPTEKFTDYDLFQIDQFLMQGKNLALFLDSFKETTTPDKNEFGFSGSKRGPVFVPFDTGLEKLLDNYGISIQKSFVLDKSCYNQKVPAQFGGGEKSIYYAPVIKNRFINHDFKFMQNIKELIALKISPIEVDEEKILKNSLLADRLFSSSNESWEMSKNINLNPLFIQPPEPDEKLQSYSLAYLIEGRFPSYFADKPIPVKEIDEKKEKKTELITENHKADDGNKTKIEHDREFLGKGRGGKIFIIASSEIIKDNLIDSQGINPNATLVMNIIDHLNNRDEIAIMRSKDQSFNPLNDTASGSKALIKIFNIAGVPALVILFGLIVWMKRISRKKNIEIMFKK